MIRATANTRTILRPTYLASFNYQKPLNVEEKL